MVRIPNLLAPSAVVRTEARLIAFYLPQFHPIPENDEWWGKGFTEWTNVVKAKPLFRGHRQPHIPADLGFYDLRVPETRIAQAELARENGISGFCYWHYWFGNGKKLLEKPFEEVVRSGEPNFPFCLAWANESWTGVWHGSPNKILAAQTYPGQEDEKEHFDYLLPAFHDARYARIDDKPIFYIYKPQNLPDPKRFIDHWRGLALSGGLRGLYFIGEACNMDWDPLGDGFDASVPHSPGLGYHQLAFGSFLGKIRNLYRKVFHKARIFSYEKYIDYAFHRLSGAFDQYPSVLPNWDNTPRCGIDGYILDGSSPALFRKHLRQAVEQVSRLPYDRRLIFIKSWNEWAEGNYLEPDLEFGRAYLEVCRGEILDS
jgi:hypothetical protein